MDLTQTLTPEALVLSGLVAFAAAFVKGAVGFAQPLIMISLMGIFLPIEIALAGLILPNMAANAVQAFRQGLASAVQSARSFGVYLAVMLSMILVTAQIVALLPERLLFLLIGFPVVLLTATMLLRPVVHIRLSWRRLGDPLIGLIAGAVGGMSGVWGPPTVLYLTALGIAKQEQIRLQGIIYGAGSVFLFLGHLQSGILYPATLGFSAMLILPALAGLWLGFLLQDRLPQAGFRRATLIILLLAGLNLLRRALIG